MPVSYCITLQYFHISHAVCFGSNGRLLRQCLYSSVSAPLPHIHESGVKVYLKLVVGSFFIKKEINPVSVNDQAVSMSSFPPSSLLIIYSSSISTSTSRLVFHSKHFKAFFAVTWDGLHVFSGEGCEIQTFASFKWAFIFIWKLKKFPQIDEISIWQQSCNQLPVFRYLSVNYQHIYQVISSKKLIVYSWLEKKKQPVNIPIALFQFLCSGQILVKPKQAPLHWEQTIQSMELQRNRCSGCWSGKDVPALTSIHSREAFMLPWQRFPFHPDLSAVLGELWH